MILKFIRRKTAFRKSVIIAPTRDRQQVNHRKNQPQEDPGTILVVETRVATIAVLSIVDQHQDHVMQIDRAHAIAQDHPDNVLEALVKRIGGMCNVHQSKHKIKVICICRSQFM